MRLETIKFLEEDIWENLHNIGFGNDFMDMTLKEQATKAKIDIKLKAFCTTKETLNRVKMHPREWEKVFANLMSYKG